MASVMRVRVGLRLWREGERGRRGRDGGRIKASEAESRSETRERLRWWAILGAAAKVRCSRAEWWGLGSGAWWEREVAAVAFLRSASWGF